jgi:hypothetical protein
MFTDQVNSPGGAEESQRGRFGRKMRFESRFCFVDKVHVGS